MRAVYYEMLGIRTDKDAIKLVAPPEERVRSFLAGRNSGPTVATLAQYSFTDISPADNAWNREVCAILADKCVDRQLRETWVVGRTPGEPVPAASWLYWEDLVHYKWVRLRTDWMRTRPKLLEDSVAGMWRYETTESNGNERSERDTRLLQQAAAELSKGRPSTRRQSVSFDPWRFDP